MHPGNFNGTMLANPNLHALMLPIKLGSIQDMMREEISRWLSWWPSWISEWNFASKKWTSTRENLSSVVHEQQRRRPACASAQSDIRFMENSICELVTGEISIF